MYTRLFEMHTIFNREIHTVWQPRRSQGPLSS